MKEYILIGVLVTMLVSTAVFSQEFDEGDRPQESAERQIHLRRMQLELEEHEMELDFHRKMQRLELEKKRIALERGRKVQKHAGHFKYCRKAKPVFLIVCFIVHILMAGWVYKDIRQRNYGSGIWIVIALLTGLFGALVYAIVRLGNTGDKTKS